MAPWICKWQQPGVNCFSALDLVWQSIISIIYASVSNCSTIGASWISPYHPFFFFFFLLIHWKCLLLFCVSASPSWYSDRFALHERPTGRNWNHQKSLQDEDAGKHVETELIKNWFGFLTLFHTVIAEPSEICC